MAQSFIVNVRIAEAEVRERYDDEQVDMGSWMVSIW